MGTIGRRHTWQTKLSKTAIFLDFPK